VVVVAAVVDAVPVGMTAVEGAGWMTTVRVLVEVRPDWSVATFDTREDRGCASMIERRPFQLPCLESRPEHAIPEAAGDAEIE
jgi:hypothetical protein